MKNGTLPSKLEYITIITVENVGDPDCAIGYLSEYIPNGAAIKTGWREVPRFIEPIRIEKK